MARSHRLEQALRNYPTLTRGDIIEISYNCLTFEILIMEVHPDAEGISIIETDLEVDFAPPKGYVEPAPRAAAAPSTMASKLHIDQAKYDVVRPAPGGGAQPMPSNAAASAFRGLGQTLSGKKTKGKKDKPITPRDPQSLVRSTEYVRRLTQPPCDCDQRYTTGGQACAGRAPPALWPAVLWLRRRASARPRVAGGQRAGRGAGPGHGVPGPGPHALVAPVARGH